MALTKRKPRKQGKAKAKKITVATVRSIAKKVCAKAPERKFMNATSYMALTPTATQMTVRNGAWVPNSKVSVIAFSNTVNSVGNGVIQTYGTNGVDGNDLDMYELEMTRPFQAGGAGDKSPYVIEGKEITPVSAINKWRMSRDIGELLKGFYLNHASSGGNEQLLIPPSDLAANLPVICRMVRVCPKLNQTKNLCFPAVDLFVNTYNNAIGVESADFDDNEMLNFRINRRKYDIVEDKFFRIQNGLTVQWQRSVWNDDTTSNSRAMVQPIITNTNANCEKLFTTSHMLTDRKGGKLHYNRTNNSPLAADSGQRREYMLFHFCYAGAETFLQGEEATTVCPVDLKLSNNATVQFTDI